MFHTVRRRRKTTLHLWLVQQKLAKNNMKVQTYAQQQQLSRVLLKYYRYGSKHQRIKPVLKVQGSHTTSTNNGKVYLISNMEQEIFPAVHLKKSRCLIIRHLLLLQMHNKTERQNSETVLNNPKSCSLEYNINIHSQFLTPLRYKILNKHTEYN